MERTMPREPSDTAWADADYGKTWPCEHCGGPIILTWNEGEREPRNDRRYCSDACKQAAYRERQS